MKLIESKTLATAAASIEFTSIPQDGTDLVAFITPRLSTSFVADGLQISFNGITTGFSRRTLSGNGASASSGSASDRFIGDVNAATSTANTFSNMSVYIPNYTGSQNKSFSVDTVSENNATTAYQQLVAFLWSNTAAITSISFSPSSGNLVAGSTISLYKITKGTDGIVTTSP